MSDESSRRFAFGGKSFALWVVLVSISVVLLIYEGDEVSLTVWVLFVCALCLPPLLYQGVKFRGRTLDLLAKGMSLESYNYTRQSRLIKAIALLGFVGLMGPLLLSGVIPADVWFGSLIGILDGWLLYLVLFNTIIWLWERRHVGTLYRLELWNGTSVAHVGLKFERHNNS